MAGVGQDALNAKVRASNQQLAALCNASGTRFVDLNAALCPAGFLAQEFTRDGIHLNWKGCLQFRKILVPHLPANPQQSQTN
jgi:lysophospholipase L1-like esterase